MKLAGLATTDRVPVTRWATYPLVLVFPNEPVMATTVGATRRSRAAARATWVRASRRSIGAVIAQARSTRAGTANAAAAAATGPWPTTVPPATATTSRPNHSAAKVRNRRVQASGAVRPRHDKPTGPAATTTAVAKAPAGQRDESRRPTTAITSPTRFTGTTVHHRNAKRDVASTR